jgi:electron transfer flavoprotein alpha subunit
MVKSLYSIKEENKTIWVFLEQSEGALEGVSLELLSKGRQMADELGWQLVGLLIGSGVKKLTKEVFAYGADQVLLANHPLLNQFTIDAYGHVAYQAIMEKRPSVFLCGATHNGRDLAGRLAVRLRTGLNADCTDLIMNPSNGVLVSEVSGFGGGVLALIEMEKHRPQMATVRPGVFKPEKLEKPLKGEIVELNVDITEEMIKTKVKERVVGEGVDLTQAENLVVGGRGVNGDYEMMQSLADLISGEVGATRPPVDEGHIERERMVGQTGTVCRPKLAVVCGVSGAFHFIVGIQDADTVIAINSDPDAPIFDFADYCVVRDVFDIIPALIKTLQGAPKVEHA